jgi:hypothetical protein
MARKKPARPTSKASKKAGKNAKKKAAPKAAARKVVKKTAKKAAKKPAKAAKSKKPAKTVAKKAKPAARKAAVKAKPAKKVAAKKVAPKAAPRKVVAKVAAKPAKKAAPAKAAALPPVKKPNLDRPRKTVADIHGIPSSLGMAGLASAAHSGGEELRDTLKKNNSASPRLTGGDVDANWQNAEAQGDESPGGDNPTPDQDVVDEIGRALGVEYADDEELQGGAEIAERDTHRWELDPSSKDDFEDEE